MTDERDNPLFKAVERAAYRPMTSPVSDAMRREAEFLCARLREWEHVCDNEECCREYGGHVSPSLARLEHILKAKEEAAAPSDRVTLAKHAIAEARIVLPKLIDHAVAHSELTDESPLIVRSLSAVHEIDAAFPRTTDMATGLALPQNTEAADQSPTDEVERLTRVMKRAMTAVDYGGEGSEGVAFIDIEAGARAALSAIKPRQTTDDEIERLRELIVELWHESEAGRKDLHHYLGMNWQQYQAWANPSAIRNGDEGMGS